MWVHGATRRFLHAIVQDAFRTTARGSGQARESKYPDTPPNDLVYFFNFFIPPYSTDDRVASPTILDWPAYLEILKGESSLDGMGFKRLIRILVDFQAKGDIVIAEALFLYRQDILHVVSRIRLPVNEDGNLVPELAVVTGGLSYLSPFDPASLREHFQQ